LGIAIEFKVFSNRIVLTKYYPVGKIAEKAVC